MKKWVDVSSGPMTLSQLDDEITHYMIFYTPSQLKVDIIRVEGSGYHCTISILTKEFKEKRK